MSNAAAFTLPPLEVPLKVFADGTEAPASDPRTDHVALLYRDAGFMLHPVSLGDGSDSQVVCEARCRDLRVLGHADWQLAPVEVWERYVIDRTRADLAVDPNLFPGIKPGWHWTATAAAGRSPSAWSVCAYAGSVTGYPRYLTGFALAVRRVGQ